MDGGCVRSDVSNVNDNSDGLAMVITMIATTNKNGLLMIMIMITSMTVATMALVLMTLVLVNSY